MRRVDVAPNEDALIESLATDSVGRNADVLRLLSLLRDVEPPYSIAVDSKWGDGKTFLVKSTCLILDCLGGRGATDALCPVFELIEANRWIVPEPFQYRCFYFNAWENDMHPDPLCALLANMAVALGSSSKGGSASLEKKVAVVIDALAGHYGLPTRAADLVKTFSGADLVKQYKDKREIMERIEAIAEEALPENAERLVVFIDELDRCEPRFAMRLLEEMKSLFVGGNVVTVYSADFDQLGYVTQGLFGSNYNGRKFLERFYDYRFTLSEVDAKRYLGRVNVEVGRRNHFDIVASELVSAAGMSMREINRLGKLREARQYVLRNVGFITKVDLFIASALIPTFVVMEADVPAQWENVRRSGRYDAVYDYGSRSSRFNKLLEMALGVIQSYVDSENAQDRSIDSGRDLVIACCTMVLATDVEVSREIWSLFGEHVNALFEPKIVSILSFSEAG